MNQTTLIGGDTPSRADQFLAQEIPGLSRAMAQKLLAQGEVTCQGKPLNKKDQIKAGQEILVTLPAPEPIEAQPEDIPLDIRYQDKDVVVVNKPVGMVVHPAPGHWEGTLVNALLHHCGSTLSGIGGALRPGIVHRIDRDTSGLLIVAKDDRAHASLTAQLQDRTLSRVYEAITQGRLREESGTVDAPLGRHPVHRKKMAVSPQGKEAVTHYQVLEEFSSHAHVECRLQTGRTHQIRVHMASLGHPLLGDRVYGQKPYPGLVGQWLHARELTFVSPSSGEKITVTADLPPEFQVILEKLRRMG